MFIKVLMMFRPGFVCVYINQRAVLSKENGQVAPMSDIFSCSEQHFYADSGWNTTALVYFFFSFSAHFFVYGGVER